MWLNYLPIKWLRAFLGWFTGENDKEQVKELKETIPEEPVPTEPAPPIRKGSLEDIEAYCEEIKGTAWIYKKSGDRLYVEVNNLIQKIERFLERRKEA